MFRTTDETPLTAVQDRGVPHQGQARRERPEGAAHDGLLRRSLRLREYRDRRRKEHTRHLLQEACMSVQPLVLTPDQHKPASNVVGTLVSVVASNAATQRYGITLQQGNQGSGP